MRSTGIVTRATQWERPTSSNVLRTFGDARLCGYGRSLPFHCLVCCHPKKFRPAVSLTRLSNTYKRPDQVQNRSYPWPNEAVNKPATP